MSFYLRRFSHKCFLFIFCLLSLGGISSGALLCLEPKSDKNTKILLAMADDFKNNMNNIQSEKLTGSKKIQNIALSHID